MAFGDSLSAGYGLHTADSFPAQLQTALRAKGFDVDVLNAGVSGDTTAGGLARLDWSLGEKPQAVILELGANDGLRGLDPELTRANLGTMLRKFKDASVAVLLAGMLAPPNMGSDYVTPFNAIYPALAEQYQVPLYPFFLDGVAAVPKLNQADGIHPTATGVAVIVQRILPFVEALIAQVQSG